MDVKKMIATVQLYIHLRKNVEIEINIRNERDLILLSQAYFTAQDWIRKNVTEIKNL